jgi:UDP-galactopyranose mutase
MDQVVAQALTIYKQISSKPSIELVGGMVGATQNVGGTQADQPATVEPVAINGNGKSS